MFVLRILLDDAHDRPRADEPREFIDVPVGIVADDPVAEPNHIPRPGVVEQVPLHVLTAELRIAILIEQALLGRQHAAESVEVDRAPFEDDPRLEAAKLQALIDSLRHDVVVIERRILAAPGVVAPIDQHRLAPLRADEKHRPMIAHPGVVRRNVVQRDVRNMSDELLRLGHDLGAAGADMHWLALRQRRGQLGPNAGNRFEVPGPTVLVPRPRKPCRGMRLPLGGHAVAESMRATRRRSR